MAKEKKSLKIQIVEYFVAGGAFFWSGYVAFFIFDSLLHFPLFAAKQLANLIGLTVNYVLADRWVFKSKRQTKQYQTRRGNRYLILMVINFGIDFIIVNWLKDRGITPYLGQFASAGFFTIWNFLWYKHWVFAPHVPKRQRNRA